mmetsp:Transcript_129920/g.323763  ORF Transcript_129920/g.323763 Transcript_129920/m.323763 type:complete len:349 (+) Transcript_129920:1-1047(+)
MSAQDVKDILLMLIDNEGGKIDASKIISQMGKGNLALKSVVDAAGGLEKFCAAHEDLEFVTAPGGHCCIKRRVQEASAQDVVDAIVKLIDKAGGKLNGAHITAELRKESPTFSAKIATAGGPKKFCEKHADLVVIVASHGPWHVEKRAVACLPGRDAEGRDTLRASDIRWSQDSIQVIFQRGTLLVDLLQESLKDPSLMQRLPPLDIVKHNGCWFAISGNRRLWVFKEYARIRNPALSIPVRIRDIKASTWAYLFKMRYTTKNIGLQVDVVLPRRLKYQRFPTMALAVEAMSQKEKLGTTRHEDSSTDSDESTSCSRSSTTSSSSGSAPRVCKHSQTRWPLRVDVKLL